MRRWPTREDLDSHRSNKEEISICGGRTFIETPLGPKYIPAPPGPSSPCARPRRALVPSRATPTKGLAAPASLSAEPPQPPKQEEPDHGALSRRGGAERVRGMWYHVLRRLALLAGAFVAFVLTSSVLVSMFDINIDEPPWDTGGPGDGRQRSAGTGELTGITRRKGKDPLHLPVFEELRPWTREALNRTAEEDARVNAERVKAVREAIMHAWGGYKQFAWGTDELQPLSKQGKQWLGLGVTLIDTLDLLWLIGERDEFFGAMQWVEEEFNPAVDSVVNVFETTIRVLAGLLSAYHYSHENVFLRKATELGAKLRSAFNSESGVPFSDVHLATGEAFAPQGAPGSSLSEATSIQLEFKYLAFLTNDQELYDLANRAMEAVQRARRRLPKELSPLPPMYIGANTGNFLVASTITLGARGDSYYEYLLKQWLVTGKTEQHYINQYNEAVHAIEMNMLAYSWPHRVAFLGELGQGKRKLVNKMDHLVCFLPGTLALGYYHGLDSRHLELARELMLTCFELYNSTQTGLAPEIAHFNTDSKGEQQYDIIIRSSDAHNILRPETVESLFYMYKVTGHSVYREWGWKIFQAFERHSRVPTGGYAGLENVQNADSAKIDKMESFWLGETLKYFYLLFSDDEEMVSLDSYVFNTEAHPIPVFMPPWLISEEADLAAPTA